MIYRTLGRTGLRVSAVSFGAGPVSGLMTGIDADAQLATVRKAVDAGINWFDTAAGYGNGLSETNLGTCLAELGAAGAVHVATKVRIPPEAFGDIPEYVRGSVQESLLRLKLPRITLLQLHNGITRERGDEPASVSVRDILGPGGVLEAFRWLHSHGLIDFLGLTGTGHPEAMRGVIGSGQFHALQVPFNMLNPSAGTATPPPPGETDYGNVIGDCAAQQMGVFAVRVYAGGALLNQPPSAHTLRTPFFPLSLYERDLARAARLEKRVAGRMPMAEAAVRFALSHPGVSSAILGLGSPAHVEEVTRMRLEEPLPVDLIGVTH
jgi:aryl-alcohol dehydrogenase-like predicted oxidoreductase